MTKNCVSKTVFVDNSLDMDIADHLYKLNKRLRKQGAKRIPFTKWGEEALKEKLDREQHLAPGVAA